MLRVGASFPIREWCRCADPSGSVVSLDARIYHCRDESRLCTTWQHKLILDVSLGFLCYHITLSVDDEGTG
jgi:hypothetical protein